MGFANFPQIGPVRFGQLLSSFGSAELAWEAPQEDLKKAGLGNIVSKKFVEYRKGFDFRKYLEQLRELKISFVTLEDEAYPGTLKQIEKPPFVLFCKGDTTLLNNNRRVAVVGTRMVTEYGREVTRQFTTSLAHSGITVVSGLALGVDAIAHTTTIDNGGQTIAVLGCGIECCYPSSNTSLYREIINKSGLIVSEYSLRMSPSKGSFPARNRIIAGLSEAILVTEGGEDSGSIITAMEGLKNGKKVFAVPGPITSRLSKGPFSLLSHGGILVTSSEEMIRELGIKNYELGDKKQLAKGETKEEQEVIDILSNESMNFDEIVRNLGKNSSEVGILLSMMEMKGYLVCNSSGKYVLSA